MVLVLIPKWPILILIVETLLEEAVLMAKHPIELSPSIRILRIAFYGRAY